MKKEKPCERCLEMIDLNRDFYVSLGTHKGIETTSMVYFHFNCWRKYIEEKTRKKAEFIVENMQERMMPIAKQMMNKLKMAIGQN